MFNCVIIQAFLVQTKKFPTIMPSLITLARLWPGCCTGWRSGSQVDFALRDEDARCARRLGKGNRGNMDRSNCWVTKRGVEWGSSPMLPAMTRAASSAQPTRIEIKNTFGHGIDDSPHSQLMNVLCWRA